MASKAETFGMVTIEAMASGVPTIGSNAGGTPEILEYGKLGFLFEPLNALSLAKSIDDFLIHRDQISISILMETAKKYDHHQVCAAVETALSL
jgi:glycosyltransferase involved in cell wall biosynthesis